MNIHSHIALTLLVTLQINGMYKGVPPRLADERAEKLRLCEDRALLAYERLCAEHNERDKFRQTIIDENQATLFDNDPTKADAFRLVNEKINALRVQKLLEKRDQDLEKCRVKNPLAKN